MNNNKIEFIFFKTEIERKRLFINSRFVEIKCLQNYSNDILEDDSLSIQIRKI